jgi:hypothetical protein
LLGHSSMGVKINMKQVIITETVITTFNVHDHDYVKITELYALGNLSEEDRLARGLYKVGENSTVSVRETNE